MLAEKRKEDLKLAKKKWQDFQDLINGKMIKVVDLPGLRKKLARKKIVFTVGAWDLLHEGHGRYLLNARKRGDVLVVGVASDASRRRRKGEGHPVVGERVRAEMLAYLGAVDYTVVLEEDNLLPVLEALRPDIFYTLEDDWEKGNRDPQEEYVVKSHGGKIIKSPRVEPYISSSEMIEKVASVKIRQIVFDALGKKVGNLILQKNGRKTKS